MHDVVFAPEALADLIALYDYIAEMFLGRGVRRDDVRPGLRVIVHGSRVSIAFGIDRATVTINRILHGGGDLSIAFDES